MSDDFSENNLLVLIKTKSVRVRALIFMSVCNVVQIQNLVPSVLTEVCTPLSTSYILHPNVCQ